MEPNPFMNMNEYLKKPVTVSILKNRLPTINCIFKLLKKWNLNEVSKIPDRFVYLRIYKDTNKKEHWKKACIVEEMIHRYALLSHFNLKNQSLLNREYYKYVEKIINTLSYLKKENIGNLDYLKSHHVYSINLEPLLSVIPDEKETLSTQLELFYTKMSIFEEIMLLDCENERALQLTPQQIENLCSYDRNVSLFNNDTSVIHNGDVVNQPYKCIVCSDGCNEYADCMYSNCNHMCVCYNCSLKLENKHKNKCMICSRYNDFLIKVKNP